MRGQTNLKNVFEFWRNFGFELMQASFLENKIQFLNFLHLKKLCSINFSLIVPG